MVEILDENGRHICYVDEEDEKEYRRIKRKAAVKGVGDAILTAACIGAEVATCLGLFRLGIKVITGR